MPKELSNEDIAWMAGIWEGEGTACITTQSQRRPFKKGIRIVASVTQKDRSMLREFVHLVGGGSIHNVVRASSWVVASKTAREFLLLIRPFVRSDRKKLQLDTALFADGKAREMAKESLRNANRRRTKCQNSLKIA